MTKATAPAWARLVRSHMALRDMSGEDMSIKMGVSPQFVSAVLKGRKKPNPKLVTRFCDAADLPEHVRQEVQIAAARDEGWEIPELSRDTAYEIEKLERARENDIWFGVACYQLLKEAGISPSSADLIAAYRRGNAS